MNKDKEIMNQGFESLDLGTTKPTARAVEEVGIVVDPTLVLANYAEAFVNEAARKNPLTFDRVQLTTDEVREYIHYLVAKRIEIVDVKCKDVPRLKILKIPAYVQHCLALVGNINLYEEGLLLRPVLSDTIKPITYEKALSISDKIGAFEKDLAIFENAMPRDVIGDVDVMSTALIADYVCARRDVHPAATYVGTFLGFKLREELAFKALYRYRYDDVQYIAAALPARVV